MTDTNSWAAPENPAATTAKATVSQLTDSNGPLPLGSNPVFAGLLTTQFLGAFNDNYFKQLVLLKCVEMAGSGNRDLQPLAMAAFALPFVLLSGFGGYLSDRLSKRSLIVWCKVAEIGVMAAALGVLLPGVSSGIQQLQLLILVLAFMGAQSAIFGPPKYGILPQLFSHRQLLPVNGAIQMTTFLAIIFGMAGAGIALDNLRNSLWMCSVIAVGIAVFGTLTSLFIRPTPVAQPQLQLRWDNLFIPREVWQLFSKQPQLARAILVMMMFWFIGGVAQPAVNSLGENVLHFSKTRTSLMAASIGIGIAVGCVIAGFVNRAGSGSGSRWTTRGSWMLVASLSLITILSSGVLGRPTPSADQVQSIWYSMAVADSLEWMLRFSMLSLGISAGIFVVPVQVFIQESPPAELKGRLIATMNVLTWIGILLSAAFVFAMNLFTTALSPSDSGSTYQFLIFGALAVIMAPLAVLYRLPEAGQS